jgi:hypothetical protein
MQAFRYRFGSQTTYHQCKYGHIQYDSTIISPNQSQLSRQQVTDSAIGPSYLVARHDLMISGLTTLA